MPLSIRTWIAVVALLGSTGVFGEDIVTPEAVMLRTALVVNDIRESTHFYTYALGYEILFDGDITKPAVLEQLQLQDRQTAHFVVLRGAKSIDGKELHGAMIGLLYVDNPPLPAIERPAGATMTTGEGMLAIVTSDIQLIYKRMLELDANVLLPPTKYGNGRESEMVVHDPNGIRIHVVQRHSE
ncbi:MAG: VOC family protein [Gammaproteobacteria bacterium]|nr:VOC family protein [Gammaproteobacteria bacterium]